MANIAPDIHPGGLNQGEEATLIYQLLNSLETLLEKLDADNVTNLDTDYEALCMTALISLTVYDQFGNSWMNHATASSSIEEHHIITPYGITDAARLAFMYQFTNAWETLCEKLDADNVTNLDTDYEANCFTAKFVHQVENQFGNMVGNGTAYYFRPGGLTNQHELVNWYYNAVDALETLTEQLDADNATNLDTDYEAKCFTATLTTKVENTQGNVVGN